MRILSGVQPSGKLHLGNYFGAIKQHIELQDEGKAFYFIADYHALTSVQDADLLRENVRDVAIAYLALGLKTDGPIFFRQSDVPEVTELTWLLSTVTGMGLLERAHSFKDKTTKGIKPSVGLFTYPVLMASDILIYQSNIVPVGQDQVQHVEMTQDMAEYFNNAYGEEVFIRPEHRLTSTPKVPGIDGQKMSKSYGNTIEIFARGKPLKKRVMAVVTDSKGLEEPKDPTTCNVFTLFSLLASEGEKMELAEKYRGGGFGYGHAKLELLAKIEDYFASARERQEELQNDPDFVEDFLLTNAKLARKEARETLDAARKACGID
ncbi:MAG: tryptophan--tRNA ligase [Planctomycetota bacterium]|nr:tryptophan--tRNA ligase [Planctomycetota bacterium]MDP7134982.1 tryptophan--tRNA ligase [Planctomycetota bacterium]MDP7253858.1 tryptophan--tRNA ligase [Planctomycetota bacterium]